MHTVHQNVSSGYLAIAGSWYWMSVLNFQFHTDINKWLNK